MRLKLGIKRVVIDHHTQDNFLFKFYLNKFEWLKILFDLFYIQNK